MRLVWAHRVFFWAGWSLLAAWVVLVGLPAGRAVIDGADEPRDWLWELLVGGIACLLARSSARGSLQARLQRRSQPASGTITAVKYRGEWSEGEGGSYPLYHWFDLWLRVVPAAAAERGPFTAFTTQHVGRAQRDLLVEGLTVPVAYDPDTGITVLAFDGHPGTFGPRTLRRLPRVRRINRRAARRW